MKYKLKKELSLIQLVLYGVGIILGAGIYSLIGVAAGIGGNAVWMSFLVAAVVAGLTGLSYAELSSMYPKAAAEYTYTKHAFNRRTLSFVVGWILILSSVFSASTVALGFAGYFVYIFGGSIPVAAAGLIAVLSLINYIGIKESSFLTSVSAVIEALGLVLVAIIGIMFAGSMGTVDLFQLPASGLYGIGAAAALIFFAYIGFEDLANVAEEAKNARKTLPKALVISIAVSTILYMLVAVSSVSILGWEALAASPAPLTEVVAKAVPNASLLMSFIALFATGNTVLILLIVTSRIMYGMAANRDLPKPLAKIGKRNTPYYAVAVAMIACIAALAMGNIEAVAMAATFSILTAYIFVNASLLWLRITKPKAKRPFKVPVNIGNFPVLAFLGMISSAAMLIFFDVPTALLTAGLIAAGIIFFWLMKRKF